MGRELLDGPAAAERIEGQQRVVRVLHRPAHEHLRDIRVHRLAHQLGPVGGERAAVDQDRAEPVQRRALHHLPGQLPHPVDAGQQVASLVIGHLQAGHRPHPRVGERLDDLLEGVGRQRRIGIQRHHDPVARGAKRHRLRMPLARIRLPQPLAHDTDPGEPRHPELPQRAVVVRGGPVVDHDDPVRQAGLHAQRVHDPVDDLRALVVDGHGEAPGGLGKFLSPPRRTWNHRMRTMSLSPNEPIQRESLHREPMQNEHRRSAGGVIRPRPHP